MNDGNQLSPLLSITQFIPLSNTLIDIFLLAQQLVDKPSAKLPQQTDQVRKEETNQISQKATRPHYHRGERLVHIAVAG
jgi:hypothetical protein